MKKTHEQVIKLIKSYLNSGGVNKYPIIEIKSDILFAYDGDCPIITIKYDAKKSDIYDDNTLGHNLTIEIEKYTTLKHGKDYVLAYQWTWGN